MPVFQDSPNFRINISFKLLVLFFAFISPLVSNDDQQLQIPDTVSFTLQEPRISQASVALKPKIAFEQSVYIKRKKKRVKKIVAIRPRLRARAVLIIGPQASATKLELQSQIQQMASLARQLRSYGVEVFEYYTPAANFANIQLRIRGANILVYQGASVFNAQSKTPQNLGGLVFDDRVLPASQISTALKLAPRAIVAVTSSFAAGNGSFDFGKISSIEAQRRVRDYSKTFLDLGVAAFFANYFENGFSEIMRLIAHDLKFETVYDSLPFSASESQEILQQLPEGYQGFINRYQIRGQEVFANTGIFLAGLKFSTRLQEFQGKSQRQNQQTVYSKAVDFEIQTTDGVLQKLSDLKGKTIHLDFSASFCAPCRRQALYMSSIEGELVEKGFVSVTVLPENDAEFQSQWLDQYKTKYIAINSEIQKAYPFAGYPTNIIIDENFQIVGHWSGAYPDASGFKRKLKTLAPHLFSETRVENLIPEKIEETDIILFDRINFQGQKKIITKSITNLKGFTPRSVILPKGRRILLFHKENYRGAIEALSQSEKDFFALNIGGESRSLFLVPSTD